jgi:allantoicase
MDIGGWMDGWMTRKANGASSKEKLVRVTDRELNALGN